MTEAKSKFLPGINRIYSYPSRTSITTEEFVKGRTMYDRDGRKLTQEEKTNKMKSGLGVYGMTVADKHEDPITLGTNAISGLVDVYDLDLDNVGYIICGTETRVDQAKASTTYMLGALNEKYGFSKTNIGVDDETLACLGGVIALQHAVEWVTGTDNVYDESALVIATDISKYALNSPGELTQGAGAVAIEVVKEDPALLTIDPVWGKATTNDSDFFRPVTDIYGKFVEEAIVDGHYSTGRYLWHMRAAYEDHVERFVAFMKNNGKSDEFVKEYRKKPLVDNVDIGLFHGPFPRMVDKAAVFLWRHAKREQPIWSDIKDLVGPEPAYSKDVSKKTFMKLDDAHRRKIAGTEQFQDFFNKKLGPGLELPRFIGNTYTGSVFFNFNSWLETAHFGLDEYVRKVDADIEQYMNADIEYLRLMKNLEGRRFAIGGYGSGASSRICSGKMSPDYMKVVDKMDLKKRIECRPRSIDVPIYESLHSKNKPAYWFRRKANKHIDRIEESVNKPLKGEIILTGIDKRKNKEGFRHYGVA